MKQNSFVEYDTSVENSSFSHTLFMQRAIELAEKGRYTAPPNPWVGALIVRDGKIVGEGYHRKAGEPHAEWLAWEKAGSLAVGADLYVTLEPCSHYGRTPPCAEGVHKAGIRRVFVGLRDPDPQVSGRGIAYLRKQGMQVYEGVEKEKIETSLLPYLTQRQKQRPFCWLKAALSIDGKIAASDYSSQWISCSEARADAHTLRASSQAILIGAKTASFDLPSLTVRDMALPDFFDPPWRVVLDARGRVAPQGPLFSMLPEKTLFFTTSLCPKARIDEWKKKGCHVVEMETSENQIPLPTVLSHLHTMKVMQVLVEGGGEVFRSFFAADLVDRLTTYVGNCLIGSNGIAFFPQEGHSMSDTFRLTLESCQKVGSTTRVDYRREDFP